MRKQYLHLSAYACDKCAVPVIAGSLAFRESEMSKETNIKQVGSVCLSCGNRQSQATEPEPARHLSPMEWHSESAIEAGHPAIANAEALNRAELR
jgi:hypothetical protein